MIFKKNKFAINTILIIILASCSSTSKNFEYNLIAPQDYKNNKDIEEIMSYESFFNEDLIKIQETIDKGLLNQSDLKFMRLLKSNYKKILSRKSYTLEINSSEKYSHEIIELIYKINLPIKVSWAATRANTFPKNILSEKISGFCSSFYDDATKSIGENLIHKGSPKLVIYSEEYLSVLEKLKFYNSNLILLKYNSGNFQEFASENLGILSSEERFKKISSLNPNQNLNFDPRSRDDFKEIILLIRPNQYKAMIPALRYYGGNNYRYLTFISILEELNNPLQLMDFEDSFIALSNFTSKKIIEGRLLSLENFLHQGILKDWLLIQVLKQSGAKTTEINGVTGNLFYQSNSCTKREIPLQRITPKLYSS